MSLHGTLVSGVTVLSSGSFGAAMLTAQTAVTNGPADALPWLGGASGGAALAILGYLLKKFLDGEMVAKPTADQQRERDDRDRQLGGLLAAGAEREMSYSRLSEDWSRKIDDMERRCEMREDALRKALSDTSQALWEHERHSRSSQ